MVVSYNILINELKKSFSEVGLRNQEKKYFINNYNEVVASYDDHSINLYFLYPKEDKRIWNHHGVVIATFARDFSLEKDNKYIDCMMIQGLWGATNSAATFCDFGWIPYDDQELPAFCDHLRKIPKSPGVELYDHSRINSCGDIFSNEVTNKVTITVGDLVISNLILSDYQKIYPNVINTHIEPAVRINYSVVFNRWIQKRGHQLTTYEIDYETLIRSGIARINDAECYKKDKVINNDIKYQTGMYSDLVGKKFGK